jgi:hypothetical protein
MMSMSDHVSYLFLQVIRLIKKLLANGCPCHIILGHQVFKDEVFIDNPLSF